MKHSIRNIFLTTMFFLYGASSLVGSESKPASLSMFKPQAATKDFKSLGISRKNAFQIGKRKYVLSGTDDNKEDEHDYGIRLYLIENNKVIFRSKGMMDSWYLNLTFFRSDTPNNRILILAEGGDEGGSYGITVYKLEDSQVKRIGYIGASILEDSENILSAVPFVEITENAGRLVFTFTRDVIVRDGIALQYKTLSRSSIRYIYDGKGDIKEIID